MPPSYTLDEMRQAAVRGAAYFAEGMAAHRTGRETQFIAVRKGRTIMVVARDGAADKLAALVQDGALGKATHGIEDVDGAVHTSGGGDDPRVLPPDARAASQAGSNGPSGSLTPPPERDPAPAPPVPMLKLLALYHEPSGEFKGKSGNVHLHALEAMTLGRRSRAVGECLCSKKHGKHERMPTEEETKMCTECVKVAAEHGLTWVLS